MVANVTAGKLADLVAKFFSTMHICGQLMMLSSL